MSSNLVGSQYDIYPPAATEIYNHVTRLNIREA